MNKKKVICIAIYAFLALMTVLSVVQGVRNALHFSQDFQWDAAKALAMKIDPYTESLSPTGALERDGIREFYEAFEAIDAPQKMEANQFPSLLFELFPLTVLPYGTAKVLWLIMNLLWTVLIILLLRKTFLKNTDTDLFRMLSLLMVAGTPWRNQIGVGQHTLFSFAFFLLAVWISEKDGKESGAVNIILSGICLSVSYFKYTLTAPIALYFIYKRKWKEFIISVIPHIVGTFMASVWLHEPFMDMIIKPLKVSAALTGEGSIDVGALTGGASWSVLITLALMIILLGAVFAVPEGMDGEVFSLLLLVSLVMTYHRSYDYFVLNAAAAGVLALRKLASEGIEKALSDRLVLLYGVVLFWFGFGMRVLSENDKALMIASVLYYGYLVIYLAVFIYRMVEIRRERKAA
ncbi:Protein of unknown function [Lachnospiraceae bacterium]|nr:Protein of unknown function [Lachnospiraceae bacterium]